MTVVLAVLVVVSAWRTTTHTLPKHACTMHTAPPPPFLLAPHLPYRPPIVPQVDDYMELLYADEMETRVRGTALILQLARDASNLEYLIQNEPLMGALSRMVKEDHKRSMDLVINIMYIFFSFSIFSQMHPLIINYRVGNETMRVIEHEMKRHAVRIQELRVLQEIADLQGRGEPVDEALWAKLGEHSGKGKGKGKGKEGKSAQEESGGKSSSGRRRDSRKRVDMDREKKKTRLLLRKQERLLFVCFHLLLNVAEDDRIERKMVKRKIVHYLVQVRREEREREREREGKGGRE